MLPWCNPCQRRHRLRELPILRMCPQWSYARSDQRHPWGLGIKSGQLCDYVSVFWSSIWVLVVNICKNLTSDDKVSAGVDVELGLGVQVLLGDGGVDDLLHDVLPQGLQSDLLAVLAGHDHGVHPDGDTGPALKHVLGSDLERKQVLCTVHVYCR